MSADFDEFSLLGEEAEAFGITVVSPPVVSRTSVTVADGTTLSALVWGTGRPQLMLLHGGGLNAHTWDSTLLELGVPAVAIDLPGHGDSDWRDDADYSPTTNAVAVTEVFDALAIGPQVLVGQSLGGLTAIAVAASRPDRVSALVIIDVSPGLVTTGGNPVRPSSQAPTVSSHATPSSIVRWRSASARTGVRSSAVYCSTRVIAMTDG